MDKYLPVLLILGVGGLIIYVVMREQQAAAPLPAVAPPSQCGASYAGTGISVPCQLVAAGIKQLTSAAKSALKPVTQEVGTLSSGIKTWEYVATPVAITHATYNGVKQVFNDIF